MNTDIMNVALVMTVFMTITGALIWVAVTHMPPSLEDASHSACPNGVRSATYEALSGSYFVVVCDDGTVHEVRAT